MTSDNPGNSGSPTRSENGLSDSDAIAASSYPEPKFEAFALKMGRGNGIPQVRKLVNKELGKGWTVSRFGDDPANFEVVREPGVLSVADAWQATYHLRARPGVLYAEPLFQAAVSGRTDWNETVPGGEPGGPGEIMAAEAFINIICGDSPALPASEDHEWSMKLVRAPEAWNIFPAGVVPGDGIVIGHPDTGYQPHPEVANNLLVNLGFDFVNNDPDAKDDMVQPSLFNPLANPGHGTGTSSVIVSRKGPAPGQPATTFVTGIAPGARLIPFRVSTSVVLLSTLNLARAIEQAATAGAHVISISMGGLGSWRLQQAVAFAQQRGVIICAAAGNCVQFVVWPAAYDEVIAVAGCNAGMQIWQGSSRGSAVDVTAPAESVWCAHATEQNGVITFSEIRGTGTSYAVATTAGVAALWLAHHGRDQLIERYGAEKIPILFNQLLRSTCTPVPGWDPGQFGAGLVNAEQLLAAPLPDPVMQPLAAPSFFLAEHAPTDRGGINSFAHLFEGTLRAIGVRVLGADAVGPAPDELGAERAAVPDPSSVLQARFAQLLNSTEAEVPHRLNEVGQELAFYMATNPALYRQFAASLAEALAPAEPTVPQPAAPATPAGAALLPAALAEMVPLAPVSSVASVTSEVTNPVRRSLLDKDTSTALRARLTPK